MTKFTAFFHPAFIASTLLLGLTDAATLRVRAGSSIQAAIDRARSGDTISVDKGTYEEQITIKKNGIKLIGKSAIITPPSPPDITDCDEIAGPGTTAGICIIGPDVELDYVSTPAEVTDVDRYVRDVIVEGFTVQKFVGINIAIVGAINTKVRKNVIVDATDYGILSLSSKKTVIAGNKIKALNLLGTGIGIDDESNTQVVDNSITSYSIGIHVQTDGAQVLRNKISKSCDAVFIDPGVGGAKIADNQISASNGACSTGNPTSGINISGAINNKVTGNSITGIKDNTPGGGAPFSNGVVISDTIDDIAVGNLIQGNKLSGNEQDLETSSTGRNKFTKNKCSKTKPPGLCKK